LKFAKPRVGVPGSALRIAFFAKGIARSNSLAPMSA